VLTNQCNPWNLGPFVTHSPTEVQASTPPSLISPILHFHSLAGFLDLPPVEAEQGPGRQVQCIVTPSVLLLDLVSLAFPFSSFVPFFNHLVVRESVSPSTIGRQTQLPASGRVILSTQLSSRSFLTLTQVPRLIPVAAVGVTTHLISITDLSGHLSKIGSDFLSITTGSNDINNFSRPK
jgi:hypothetical protein